MEPDEQPVEPAITMKPCFVPIKKLNISLDGYDSDSSFELPELPFFPSTRKPKIKKSAQEQLLEIQNLVENIEVDVVHNNDVEELLKSLEIIHDREVDDDSLTPPLLPEENYISIFYNNDTLQFFNVLDVTPSVCGYQNCIHSEVATFERELLLSKRVELQHVISSVLFSSNAYCISDCKSFITYLLRILSVCDDVATVYACFNVLKFLLINTGAKNLTFSSAEIFMLLFNHGIDIDSFKFLHQWPNILKSLEVPQCQSKISCRIPQTWTLNLKLILKATMNLISSCSFKTLDLTQISIFFLWMSLDSKLLQENLYSTVQECISVSLDYISNDKWEKSLSNIARILISMEFSSEKEKWRQVYHMTQSIPVTSERGIQLRKQISLLALNSICLENSESDSEQENCIEYNLNDLHQLLKKLVEIDSNLLNSATKFVDIYITHLSATTEEYQELCNILKCAESVVKPDDVKAHFMKIHAKLKLLIGKKTVFQISPFKSTPRKIKIEVDDSCRVFPATSKRHTSTKIKSEIQEACTANESNMLFIDIIKSEPALDYDFTSNYVEQEYCSTSKLPEDLQSTSTYSPDEINIESSRPTIYAHKSDESSQDIACELTDHIVEETVEQSSLNASPAGSNQLERIPSHKERKDIKNIRDGILSVMSYRRNLFSISKVLNEDDHWAESDQSSQNLSNEITDDAVKKSVVKGSLNTPAPVSISDISSEDEEHVESSPDLAFEITDDAVQEDRQNHLFATSTVNDKLDAIPIPKDDNDIKIIKEAVLNDKSCVRNLFGNFVNHHSESMPQNVNNLQLRNLNISLSDSDDIKSHNSKIETEPEVIVTKEVNPSQEKKMLAASSGEAIENLNIKKGQPELTEKMVKMSDVKKKVVVIDDEVEFVMDIDTDIKYIEPETKVAELNGDCQENVKLDNNEIAVERHSAVSENVGSTKSELSRLVVLKAAVANNEVTVDGEFIVNNNIEFLTTDRTELSNSAEVSCPNDFVSSNTALRSPCKEALHDILDSIVTDVCFSCNENEVLIDKAASIEEESILELQKALSNDSELSVSHNIVGQYFETRKTEKDAITEAKIPCVKSEFQSISTSDNFLNSPLDVDDLNHEETDIDKCSKDAVLDVILYRKSLFRVNSEALQDGGQEFHSSVIDKNPNTSPHITSVVSNLEISDGKLKIPIKKELSENEETLTLVHAVPLENQSTLIERRSPLSPVYSSDIAHMLKRNHTNHPSNILTDLNQGEGSDFISTIPNIKTEMLPSHSQTDAVQVFKRKHPESFINSSPKIKKYDVDSKLTENVAVTRKRKVRPESKSSPNKKYISTSKTKSPNKFFNYVQRKQKYIASKNHKHSLLNRTGRNLPNILRQNISCSENKPIVCLSSDESDPEIVQLYCDPKRYADKDCMIIYESEELVVLDSD